MHSHHLLTSSLLVTFKKMTFPCISSLALTIVALSSNGTSERLHELGNGAFR